MSPDHNPFATRWIRPDANPFVFPEGQTARGLAIQLARQHGWGQITGPHGTGKSTLLHALAPEFRAAGCDLVWFTQRHGETRLTVEPDSRPWSSKTLVVVDGYEQLGWAARQRLKWRCRRQGSGLLVTAHRGVGLPTLFETQTSLALAQVLVAQLLVSEGGKISAKEIREAFDHHAGNLREMLFSLYDVFELQRRRAAADSVHSA